MASKAQVLQRMKATGVTLYRQLDWDTEHTATMDAPDGFYFAANGLHSSTCNGETMPQLWSAIMEDMSYGVRMCDSNCDSCKEGK
jgi:hypothetical protein